MYPWRKNRMTPESHQDNQKTPYTDRHNMNEFTYKKAKKPWMNVVPRDRDRRYQFYRDSDHFKSDPVEAKQTAAFKMRRFSDSLKHRGHARETLPYEPPADVRERILAIIKATQIESPDAQSNPIGAADDNAILDIDLNANRPLKFDLLTRCIDEFSHDLPTSSLTETCTVRDLVEYFSTPVRGVSPYSALLKQEDSLPPNLHMIAEAHRFDKDTDIFFKGYTAYPGLVSKVHGLRAAKKYPVLNQDEFQWPDI